MRKNISFQKSLKKGSENSPIIRWLQEIIYIYRYDIFVFSILFISITIYLIQLLKPGHIVFSDIDFPFYSRDYLDEVWGLWNVRWNTTAMLNVPRLILILPAYLVGFITGHRGDVMLKFFIFQQIYTASIALYILAKRIVSIYLGKDYHFIKIAGLTTGSLLYALNPWVLFRIQHIYLLCGYSLFPFVILYFFKVFDPKFQSLVIPKYNTFNKKLYKENIRDIWLLAYFVAISAAAIHYFFYSVIAFSILIPLYLIKYLWLYRRENKQLKWRFILINVKKIAVFIGAFLTLGGYWFFVYVGSLLLKIQTTQHNVNVIDTYVMFSRNSDWSNVLEMIGYWWPMFDLNQLPTYFHIGFAIVFIFIFVGIVTRGFRHHILLLLTLVGMLSFVFATGVHYPFIAPYFVKLTELPIFGNLFRDPNKLIGILALCYSILFIFGVEQVNYWLVKYKSTKYLSYGITGIAALSVIIYVWPLRTFYLEAFYDSVDEPVAFKELRHFFEDKEDTYGLYLPLSEKMLRPYVKVATPYWNGTGEDKMGTRATGDIHIYNSPIKTLFHHEGNAPSVGYYLSFVQHLLDQGRSQYIREYTEALGVNTLVYHTEYLDQNERQQFNSQVLKEQGLTKVYENSIFDVYHISFNNQRLSNRKIWSPYGLSKFEGYHSIKDYHPLSYPTIFINDQTELALERVKEDDYMELKDSKDIVLATLPEVYYTYPFQWMKDGNPFLKWTKTYLSHGEWKWYLESQGILNQSYDFDRDQGVAVTFASNQLDLLPYLKNHVEGRLIADFDSLLRSEKFFQADNPDLFEVQANPIMPSNPIPLLRGEIVKGDPKQIWQVAKSGLLKADEGTPYQFRVTVSGRGVNQFHIKARFFNIDQEELYLQYVVAPEEFINFDVIDFRGEFVSPPETAFIRLDLLTFQRPEQRNYWWIHDVKLIDLSEYSEPNTISSQHSVNTSGWHKIYVRSFVSPKGGQIQLAVEDAIFNVSTKSLNTSSFNWIEAGRIRLDEGVADISLENIQGFNAVNALVIVPEEQWDILIKPAQKAMEKATLFTSLESEIDFQFKSHVQSRRLAPLLSYGGAVSLSEGELSTSIEIVKDGHYKMTPTFYFPYDHMGEVNMKLINIESSNLVFQQIVKGKSTELKAEKKLISRYAPIDHRHPFSSLYLDTLFNGKESKESDLIYLKKGKYQLNIEIDSQVSNLYELNEMDKFDPSTVIVPEFIKQKEQDDCSPCESIDWTMMQHAIKDEVLEIQYDPTCSCDWYVYASPIVAVKPYEELLLKFDARSDYIQKRHFKILFLDSENKLIDTTYIQEVEEQNKRLWNAYETLVEVPENVSKMIFQILARGHMEQEGVFEMKNLLIQRYADFVSFDHVLLMEDAKRENKTIGELTNWIQNQGKYSFEVKQRDDELTLVNTFLSPLPLWRINQRKLDYKLNSVTAGFELEQSGSYTGHLQLYRIYLIFVLIHAASVLAFIIWMGYDRGIKGEYDAKENSDR